MSLLLHLSITAACLFMAGFVFAQTEGVLDDEQRTNGTETLKALADIRAKAVAGTVLIGRDKDSALLCGTIVTRDGYLLTKASEAAQIKPLNVILQDGSLVPAREVKRDETRDLVLLKIERDSLTGVTWNDSKTLRPAQWLCAITNHGQDMRLGVVSAARRVIPNSGAVMGIRMATDRSESEGVVIERVTEESPAEKAGLKARDIIVALNGKPVDKVENVREALAKMRPGDAVKLRYTRAGAQAECEVRLASRSRVELGHGDFANHGTSTRTDNFPEVIQHDMPLSPADMGGAVYDLQGRAVGLNIARVDRVTNFALPSEVFQADVQKWIDADRATRK
jgi:serine protease Do